jgi:hypothetical protein
VTDYLHDVGPERRAAVALDTITAARQQHDRDHRRPRALSAREALAALQFEALLVFTAAANIRAGIELSDEDFDRLAVAARWIETIVAEVV